MLNGGLKLPFLPEYIVTEQNWGPVSIRKDGGNLLSLPQILMPLTCQYHDVQCSEGNVTFGNSITLEIQAESEFGGQFILVSNYTIYTIGTFIPMNGINKNEIQHTQTHKVEKISHLLALI